MHPANKISNIKRRIMRARNFPVNTCPASRHLQLIAEDLAAGRVCHALEDDPVLCAASMLSVLESLYKTRTRLARKQPNA